MAPPTRQDRDDEDHVIKNMIYENAERERAKSDSSYAIKLVELVVFGLVALITTGVVGALLALVLRK